MQEWASEQVAFYKKIYQAASKGNYDIYVVFIEKALSLLNKKGELGFILPHKFFNAQYGEPVRKLVAQGKHICQSCSLWRPADLRKCDNLHLPDVFEQAGRDEFEFTRISDLENWRGSQSQTSEVFETSEVSGTINAATSLQAEWNFSVGKDAGLFEKLSQMPTKLENVTLRIFQGIKTSADKIYIVEEWRKNNKVKVFSRQTEMEHWLDSELLHPLVKGGDSKRYSLQKTNRLLLFPYA